MNKLRAEPPSLPASMIERFYDEVMNDLARSVLTPAQIYWLACVKRAEATLREQYRRRL